MIRLTAPTTLNSTAPNAAPLALSVVERQALRGVLAGPSARELWDARGRYAGAVDTHPAAHRYPAPGDALVGPGDVLVGDVLPPPEPEPGGNLPIYLYTRIKSKVEFACPSSRLVLAGADGGKTHLIAVGCGRNSCGFCGRKKARRFIRRVGERLDLDKASGLEQQTRTLFVTFTLRRDTPGKRSALSVADSFRVVHKAVAFSLRSLRRTRKGGRIWGGVVAAAWPGLSVDFVNNVDVTVAGMAHIHALVRVRALPGGYVPTESAIRAHLHNAFNRAIYDYLGRSRLPFYKGGMALGHVDLEPSRNTTAAVRYMALHNGKVWRGAWVYPDRFRRLATSRRFLAPVDKGGDGTEWTLIKKPLWCCTAALAQVGIESDVLGPSHAVVNLPRDNNSILRYVDGVTVKTVPRVGPLDPDLADALRTGLTPDEWREYRADGMRAIATPYSRS